MISKPPPPQPPPPPSPPKTYFRFTVSERSYHWSYAIPFLFLMMTGFLLVMVRCFQGTGIRQDLIFFHKFWGIVFIFCPFLVALGGDCEVTSFEFIRGFYMATS
jgi:cytochrome b subunit of formate dehydrogenase